MLYHYRAESRLDVCRHILTDGRQFGVPWFGGKADDVIGSFQGAAGSTGDEQSLDQAAARLLEAIDEDVEGSDGDCGHMFDEVYVTVIPARPSVTSVGREQSHAAEE